MSDSAVVLTGTISWLAEDAKTGIISRMDDTPPGQPTDFFFDLSSVLIGVPEIGKLAQFTPDFTDPARPIAQYIILLEDAAKGARINAQFEQK